MQKVNHYHAVIVILLAIIAIASIVNVWSEDTTGHVISQEISTAQFHAEKCVPGIFSNRILAPSDDLRKVYDRECIPEELDSCTIKVSVEAETYGLFKDGKKLSIPLNNIFYSDVNFKESDCPKISEFNVDPKATFDPTMVRENENEFLLYKNERAKEAELMPDIPTFYGNLYDFEAHGIDEAEFDAISEVYIIKDRNDPDFVCYIGQTVEGLLSGQEETGKDKTYLSGTRTHTIASTDLDKCAKFF